MRTFILVTITSLAIAAAGCKEKTGAASFTSVPVCAPYTELAPPTEGGVVWFCDARALHVIYDGGDAHALGTKYEAAILAHGWVRRIPVNEREWQWLGVYDK